MDNDKRALLEQRRQQLQVKRKAEAYIAQYITPVQEIIDFLYQREVTHKIVRFTQLPVEYHPYVEQAIGAPLTRSMAFGGIIWEHLVWHS